MFTGLIETVGTIKDLRVREDYRVLSIAAGFTKGALAPGESVACDGACLTVISANQGIFEVEASQETTKRTIINSYTVGSQINLERALVVGSRVGGHFVSGHVDGTGVVDYLRHVGQSFELAVRFESHFDRLVIDKGSIAINGVSLTINSSRRAWFNVNLIPITVKETTLGLLKAGDRVNLEFDMIGKYILKIQESGINNTLTREKLIESGW